MNESPEKKLLCHTCNANHNGRVGAGKFCSIACSKRVGAKARWSKRAQRSGKTSHVVVKPVVHLVAPDADVEYGLRGEQVVVTRKQGTIHGWIKEYAPATDRHCVIDERGKCFWIDLRSCEVQFVDDNHKLK